MPEQHVEAGKVDEAEEILDVIFPSGDKAAEVVQPCKEPLDFPAPAVAAQFAAILTTAPVAPVGARSSRCRIPHGACGRAGPSRGPCHR